MKLKVAVKYQLWEARKSVLTFYGIILLLIMLFSILNRFSSGNMSAMDGVTPIFLFVFGIVTFSTAFKFYMQSGLSRKLLAQSILITFTIGCFFMLLADLIITMICTFIDPGYISATKQAYPYFGLMPRYFFHYCLLLLMPFVGYFIGALYYRMNKLLTIVVSICAPVILIFFFAGVNVSGTAKGVSEPSNLNYLTAMVNYIFESPIHIGVFLLILAAIFAFLSYLLTRRAFIK